MRIWYVVSLFGKMSGTLVEPRQKFSSFAKQAEKSFCGTSEASETMDFEASEAIQLNFSRGSTKGANFAKLGHIGLCFLVGSLRI